MEKTRKFEAKITIYAKDPITESELYPQLAQAIENSDMKIESFDIEVIEEIGN